MFMPVKKLVDLDTQIFYAGCDRDCFVSNMEEWFLVVRLLNHPNFVPTTYQNTLFLATLRDNLFSSSHDLKDCRSLFTALLIEEIDFEEL